MSNRPRVQNPDRFRNTLLRAALENSPHHGVKGQACFSLADYLWDHASWAKALKDPAKAGEVEGALGPDILKRVKASDPDELLREAERLFERTVAEYADVKAPRGTLGELAKAALFEMRHLVVGKVAPDIEGEDVDGQRFKLSDYRGRVVVLTFWGFW